MSRICKNRKVGEDFIHIIDEVNNNKLGLC